MTIGPGKYDAEATHVMNSTHASGVIVIVIGGDRGEGFSIQATLEVSLALPKMLRMIADQLDPDISSLQSKNEISECKDERA
jgi:hypothetical protein